VLVIDTHVWYRRVHTPEQLTRPQTEALDSHSTSVLGVSAISCWEIAKRVQNGRMRLPRPVGQWLTLALRFPGVRLLPLTPEIAVASTQLPGTFQKDLADQIIVATARVHGCPLLTSDRKILDYPYVETIA